MAARAQFILGQNPMKQAVPPAVGNVNLHAIAAAGARVKINSRLAGDMPDGIIRARVQPSPRLVFAFKRFVFRPRRAGNDLLAFIPIIGDPFFLADLIGVIFFLWP